MQARLSTRVCLTFGLITTLSLTTPATAEVTLPRLVSDGMVLQREAPVKIWGWADAGERVQVEFLGEQYRTEASDGGDWSITLKPAPAGGPHTLRVRGDNEIQLNDILLGDVWLASGQSNMEYPINRIAHAFADEIAAVDNPRIRQFQVPQTYDFNAPQLDLSDGQWLPATPQNIQNFSAVAYFFADKTQQREQVPIGVINSSLGGSPAEAWVSEETLQQFPAHLAEKKKFEDSQRIESIRREDRARSDRWYATAAQKDRGQRPGKTPWYAPELETKDWETFSVPGYWADQAGIEEKGVFWLRKTITLPQVQAGKAALLELGRIVDADETWINGHKVGNTTYLYPRRRYQVPAGVLQAGENVIAIRVTNNGGARGGFVEDKPYQLTVGGESLDLKGPWQFRQSAQLPQLESQTFVRWKPGGLYNAMLHPLQNYRIKGALWYQGESNVGRAQEYRKLFPALIRDWRAGWAQNAGQQELPFLFVQLANFLEPKTSPGDSAWAELRAAQASALSLDDTAMAVIIDAGEWNDIHPLDKKTVGERLALAAASRVYGHKDITGSGPQLQSAQVNEEKIVLSFSHTDGGLTAKPCASNCSNRGPASELFEFAVAGSDGKFHWANARINGRRVEVWSDQVPVPEVVRYAWADNPTGANLYNGAGLPAAPFQITAQARPPETSHNH
ncbi:sialate O-acetylesterase [Microbulbifer hydrolyticus]|uniref:Sialate O-acetylesterase n=1 Tax=Microbulbifer hydrolyticus TaxID=48074 RepID=A0A6P1TEX0_9GAMM|nr:sialate O-acetylesterase [Microbulbifer hydrolyticus]MBB5212591.1 sialate O-acetylesterase [Microbulbifer hydrolyticus]QHQ40206.1 sialate O-acetylesterase [Microbulbifer hydrolyticus]